MNRRIAKAATYTGAIAACAALTITPSTTAAPPAADPLRLVGKTVFLDPGHQGPGHNQHLARQVDNGRGGVKACQTTGMTTRGGVPEHVITWKVSQLVKASLESLGARVVLSRPSDNAWGGCVNDRAAAANNSGAAVAASIHADGGPASQRGFHMIIPQLPIPNAKANQVQSTEGLKASKVMRDAYLKAGFQPAGYVSAVNGLQTRADIAGPALTTVPNVFIEMGNGANAEDAKTLETPDGQARHAIAITTGLVSYLIGVPVSAGTPAASSAPSSTPATASATATKTTATSSAPATPQATGASTTTATATKTPSVSPGGLVPSALSVLRPLLELLGIDIGAADSPMIAALNDLASVLLAPK